MTLAGGLRARRYAPGIERIRALYAAEATPSARAAIQLEALNAEWARIVTEVPFYGRRRAEGSVPARFGSLEEFARSVPPTTRADVRAHLGEMTSRSRPAEFSRMTGGSTAEPVQLPAWTSENLVTRPDMWLGRSWYGLTPSSRLFLLWGHSHLLGTGVRGWLRKWKVRASDALLGYRRFSAYDLRPERLQLAARALVDAAPDYVIGYSVALDLFARHNADMASALRSIGLKVVIGTSESFPASDSARRLEELFDCPVGMEYGAVETALVAHTHPASGYRVFWRTYMAEAVPHETGHRLLVTSLFPRCFPLVRYDLGDEIVLDEEQGGGRAIGLASFRRVIGRCNDYVILDDGAVIHSEVFTHAVRGCALVDAYQVVQEGSRVGLRYLSAAPLSQEQIDEIRRKLTVAHPGLERIVIERVDALKRTVAGKTPMVIRSRQAG